MKKLSLLAVLTILLVSTALVEKMNPLRAGENNPKSTVDLMFLGIARPMVIRLQVSVDNHPAERMLRGYIQKWVNFLDQDGDGALNVKELKLMPNAQEFKQILTSGNYSTQTTKPMTMDDFGKLEGDNITSGEILNYYRRNGLELLQITGGNSQGGTNTSGVDRLFEVLDSNHDGKLSRQEIDQAPKILVNLDANDDEYLEPQELGQIQTVNQPPLNNFVTQRIPSQNNKSNLPDAFSLIPKGSPTQFSLLLLTRYDKNKDTKISRVESGLAKRDFDRIDRNRDNQLDVTELIGMVRNSTTMPVEFNLGKNKKNDPMVALAGGIGAKMGMQIQRSGDDTLHLLLEEAKITVRGEDHSKSEMMMMGNSTAKQILRQQYNLANPKSKDFLTIADINGGRFQFLVNLFPILDRNRDGKITPVDLDAYADLQAEGVNYQLTLNVTEDGRGLFQLLDTDRDRRLSPRELLRAWKSLELQDRNKDGYLSANEFSQQYALTLTRGQTGNRGQMNLGPLVEMPGGKNGQGPSWFQKMDVNGDGDVSRREFLGNQADFERLDRNQDGLIDAQEANQAVTKEAKK